MSAYSSKDHISQVRKIATENQYPKEENEERQFFMNLGESCEKWAKNATSGSQMQPYYFITAESGWHSVP